jgi:hypothetical protein
MKDDENLENFAILNLGKLPETSHSKYTPNYDFLTVQPAITDSSPFCS